MPSGELDVHDGALMKQLMKQLMDYLPLSLDAAKRLLITTRNKGVADSLGQSASPIPIGPISWFYGHAANMRLHLNMCRSHMISW